MRILDFIQEGARHVAVGRYRSDFRLLDFLLCVVRTYFLIYANEIVVEIAVGKIQNLLLRQFLCTLELRSYVCPVAMADKCVNHFAYAVAVALQRTEIVEFHIVDNRREQVVAELSALEFLKLFKNQCTQFFEGLTLFRTSRNEEHRIVIHSRRTGAHTLHLHRLLKIGLEESSLTVSQHVADNDERINLSAACAVEAPSKTQVLCLLTHDGRVYRCRDGWLRSIFRTGKCLALLP